MEDNMNINVEPTNEEGQQNGNEETVSYTKEELDALIQRESDRRVSQALKTAQKKNEAKVKEAEKLAKMNEQQRYEYELTQREQAIADKERQLALAENKAEASSILAEKGISPKLVDFVVAEDAEVMMNNIQTLEAEFKASVKAEVEKRLATTTPKKNLPVEMTKESFQKLSIVERTQLLRNNPELYNKLKGV